MFYDFFVQSVVQGVSMARFDYGVTFQFIYLVWMY